MCYDGDACDVWDARVVKAAKGWRCDECHGPIPKGTQHTRIGSLFEGSWTTNRVHTECLDLWNRVQKEICGGKGLIMIGGLGEEIEQARSEYSHDSRLSLPEYDAQVEALSAAFEAIRAKYEKAAGEGKP